MTDINRKVKQKSDLQKKHKLISKLFQIRPPSLTPDSWIPTAIKMSAYFLTFCSSSWKLQHQTSWTWHWQKYETQQRSRMLHKFLERIVYIVGRLFCKCFLPNGPNAPHGTMEPNGQNAVHGLTEWGLTEWSERTNCAPCTDRMDRT